MPWLPECPDYQSALTIKVPWPSKCPDYQSARATRVPWLPECTDYQSALITKVPRLSMCPDYQSAGDTKVQEHYVQLLHKQWDKLWYWLVRCTSVGLRSFLMFHMRPQRIATFDSQGTRQISDIFWFFFQARHFFIFMNYDGVRGSSFRTQVQFRVLFRTS